MSFSLADIPPMASSRASLVFSLCTNTLYDDTDRQTHYAKDDTSTYQSPPPLVQTRRHRPRSLSLISARTASFFTADDGDSDSTWFDETPRRNNFIFPGADTDTVSEDERVSIASSEAMSQWFEDSKPATAAAAFHSNDAMSFDTFGLPRWTSSRSSPYDSQEDASTASPAPSDTEDSESLRTIDSKLVLDEQLLHSPIDSFEAMCWDATEASHEKPVSKLGLEWNPKLAEFRHSRLYGDVAHKYEARHSVEAERLCSGSDLPKMRFNAAAAASPAPKAPTTRLPLSSRLAGVEYLLLSTTPQQHKFLPHLTPVSRKAAKVLDLPCDMSIIPALLDMPSAASMSISMPYAASHDQRMGSLPRNIADKWKRAVKSLRPM